jgi:hypothetical protein
VHTHYVANILKERFNYHHFDCKIYFSYSENIQADLFLVICPQIFPQLPPADKRIIFQMEQSTSTRWFTKKYIGDLIESKAALDYSLENIRNLVDLGIPSHALHYLPIGATTAHLSHHSHLKECDFIFYGDYSSSLRRQDLLKVLSEKYKVVILQDVFEDKLFLALSTAKAVINIHYYEKPLLETTRICECLSLGLPVLSEATSDMSNYPEFLNAVTYFEFGSADDLLRKADCLMKDLPSSEVIGTAATRSEKKFQEHFDQIFTNLKILRNS